MVEDGNKLGGVHPEADAFYDDRQIAFNLKVMEKASSDKGFRELLNKDPEGALEKAGLLEEAQAMVELDAQEGEDVSGHRLIICSFYRTCRWWQARIWWHRR